MKWLVNLMILIICGSYSSQYNKLNSGLSKFGQALRFNYEMTTKAEKVGVGNIYRLHTLCNASSPCQYRTGITVKNNIDGGSESGKQENSQIPHHLTSLHRNFKQMSLVAKNTNDDYQSMNPITSPNSKSPNYHRDHITQPRINESSTIINSESQQRTNALDRFPTNLPVMQSLCNPSRPCILWPRPFTSKSLEVVKNHNESNKLLPGQVNDFLNTPFKSINSAISLTLLQAPIQSTYVHTTRNKLELTNFDNSNRILNMMGSDSPLRNDDVVDSKTNNKVKTLMWNGLNLLCNHSRPCKTGLGSRKLPKSQKDITSRPISISKQPIAIIDINSKKRVGSVPYSSNHDNNSTRGVFEEIKSKRKYGSEDTKEVLEEDLGLISSKLSKAKNEPSIFLKTPIAHNEDPRLIIDGLHVLDLQSKKHSRKEERGAYNQQRNEKNSSNASMALSKNVETDFEENTSTVIERGTVNINLTEASAPGGRNKFENGSRSVESYLTKVVERHIPGSKSLAVSGEISHESKMTTEQTLYISTKMMETTTIEIIKGESKLKDKVHQLTVRCIDKDVQGCMEKSTLPDPPQQGKPTIDEGFSQTLGETRVETFRKGRPSLVESHNENNFEPNMTKQTGNHYTKKRRNRFKMTFTAEKEDMDSSNEDSNDKYISPKNNGLRGHKMDSDERENFSSHLQNSEEVHGNHTTEKHAVYTETYSGFDSAWKSSESYPSLDETENKSKRTKNEGYRRSVMSLNPGLDNGNPIIPTNEGKIVESGVSYEYTEHREIKTDDTKEWISTYVKPSNANRKAEHRGSKKQGDEFRTIKLKLEKIYNCTTEDKKCEKLHTSPVKVTEIKNDTSLPIVSSTDEPCHLGETKAISDAIRAMPHSSKINKKLVEVLHDSDERQSHDFSRHYFEEGPLLSVSLFEDLYEHIDSNEASVNYT